MNVYEAIANRHSTRSFTEKKIPRQALERILAAGTLAPTARNEQKHRAIAVTDPAVIGQLMPQQPHVGKAPCVLAVYFDGENRKMACGQSAREQDCVICLAYMALAAMEEGLQGCWLGGFEAERARKLLDLPESATVVALHTLGYPQGEIPHPQKQDPSSLYEIH